jgi:hypothetical protein
MRYQWSNKYKDEIVVVEATDDKWEDFILAIDKARTTFNTPKAENLETFPNDEPQSKQEERVMEDGPLGYCTIHSVQMKERQGKFGIFYSHSTGTYPALEWCSGKGYGKK